MQNRTEGYYWVKHANRNTVAFYVDNGLYLVWRLPGINGVFEDSDFSEINETRIPAPDEAKQWTDDEWLKDAYFRYYTHVSYNHFVEQIQICRQKIDDSQYNEYGQPIEKTEP